MTVIVYTLLKTLLSIIKNIVFDYFSSDHSTHLLQSFDVSVFQKFKHELKELIREKVFLRAKEISKADFFVLFNKFSAKTFKLQ